MVKATLTKWEIRDRVTVSEVVDGLRIVRTPTVVEWIDKENDLAIGIECISKESGQCIANLLNACEAKPVLSIPPSKQK